MTEPKKTAQLPSIPGVRRDGTVTDSNFYNDAQWVRFIRKDKGRPRKMGGYSLSTNSLSGPIRGSLVWSHQFVNRVVNFSQYGVEYVDIDSDGLGGTPTVITPAGYLAPVNALWSYDYLYDSGSGANATIVLASPVNTLTNLDDPTLVPVYWTQLNSPGVMVAMTDTNALTSGGLFCTAPYSVLLGNDGNITWSDANSPQNYGGSGTSPGDAGSARITGTKLVKGLPMRTGSGPGALIWSLDSVLRMDYIGGSAIFKFSHISTKSSVMSQNGVIEYDGMWYWLGIDRFLVSNGSQVSELPNDMNKNWFFDNVNFSQRQKIFAMKMPRWGEIWWFFPFGDATECTNAIIFNINLQTWYDVALTRSWGVTPSVFYRPLMYSNQYNGQVTISYSVSAGTVAVGDYIRGSTSGAEGNISYISGAGPFTALVTMVNNKKFASSESFTDITSAATGTISTNRNLYSMYVHEVGNDAVESSTVNAIPAWFETCNFGFPTGSTQINSQEGLDVYTRLTRVEPDFVVDGDMTLHVLTREFSQSPDVEVKPEGYTFNGETGKIDLREQGRQIRVKFMSNTQGGFFEAGENLLYIEQGDVRA